MSLSLTSLNTAAPVAADPVQRALDPDTTTTQAPVDGARRPQAAAFAKCLDAQDAADADSTAEPSDDKATEEDGDAPALLAEAALLVMPWLQVPAAVVAVQAAPAAGLSVAGAIAQASPAQPTSPPVQPSTAAVDLAPPVTNWSAAVDQHLPDATVGAAAGSSASKPIDGAAAALMALLSRQVGTAQAGAMGATGGGSRSEPVRAQVPATDASAGAGTGEAGSDDVSALVGLLRGLGGDAQAALSTKSASSASTTDTAPLVLPSGLEAAGQAHLQRLAGDLTTGLAAQGVGDASDARLSLPGEGRAWQQPLLQALGDRLQVQIAARSEQARLHLEPPQLGRIEIEIRQQGGALQVQLSATNDEVRQQLRQISEPLRHDLVQRHSGDVSVQVGGASAGADARGRGDGLAQGQSQNGQSRDAQRQPGRAWDEEIEATASFHDALAGQGLA